MSSRLPYSTRKATAELLEACPDLARTIALVGPCKLSLRTESSTFESLMRAIVFQSVSTAVATQVHERVVRAISRKGQVDWERTLRTPDTRLRNAGLSWAKVAAIKDLARKTKEGIVPAISECAAFTDQELIERISSVRGIGKWTVEMLLIFRLGRPDVLPSDDLAIRKGFMLTTDLDRMPSPREVDAFGERWRPYRSVASWYLWRRLDV